LRHVQAQADDEGLCDVFLYAGASADHLDELPDLARLAVGLKIYLDQTYGPLRVNDLATLSNIFQRWPREKVIAMHAEGLGIAVGLGLAAAFDRSVHFCHVSRKHEILLIAQAKAQGFPVTCEVTPHHLFLTEDDLADLGPLGDMRPTLASPEDVAALWDHIDTTIDCIATDHAPHTLEEKRAADNPPPGVPGLETALPLMMTAVNEGRLSWERLVALMSENPRRIFDLPAQPEAWVEVDPTERYRLTNDRLHTKCGWTPFAGRRVQGKIKRVAFGGQLVFQDGEVVNG
jgi:carbamoyl-phosphate synthase/aspartate carbamoyltransferase/dihydroorotase